VTVSEIQSFRKSGERQSPRNERRSQRCMRSMLKIQFDPIQTTKKDDTVPDCGSSENARKGEIAHLPGSRRTSRRGKPDGRLLRNADDCVRNAANSRRRHAHSAPPMCAPRRTHAQVRRRRGGKAAFGGHRVHPRTQGKTSDHSRRAAAGRATSGGAARPAIREVCRIGATPAGAGHHCAALRRAVSMSRKRQGWERKESFL
jgi:hypothetical protein